MVRINWFLRGIEHIPETEGAIPSTLWRLPGLARRDCAQKNQLAIEEVQAALVGAGEEQYLFNPSFRESALMPVVEHTREASLPTQCEQQTHCEVMQVERGEPELGLPVERLQNTAFLVMRWSYRREIDRDDPESALVALDHMPDYGGVPVRVFRDVETAQQHAEVLHLETLRQFNPFRLGYAGWITERNSYLLVATALAEIGLTLPAFRDVNYNGYLLSIGNFIAWWDRFRHTWSDRQLNTLISQFPHLRFFGVLEVAVGDPETDFEGFPHRLPRKVFVVRSTSWEPSGGPYSNPHRVLGAFTDRSVAEARYAEATDAAKRGITPLPMDRDATYTYDWTEYSSWPIDKMRERFLELGLIDATQTGGFRPDCYWWEDRCERFSEGQRLEFWKVLDRVRFYVIQEFTIEGAP